VCVWVRFVFRERKERRVELLFPQANNLTPEVFARFIYTDFLKGPLIVSPASQKETNSGRTGGWVEPQLELGGHFICKRQACETN
jgi:hypothetical protein